MAKAHQLNQFKRRFYLQYLTDSSEFFLWILIWIILQNEKKTRLHWHQLMHIYAHETGVEINNKSRLEFIYFPLYYLMLVSAYPALDCEMHAIHLRLKKSAIQFYLVFLIYCLIISIIQYNSKDLIGSRHFLFIVDDVPNVHEWWPRWFIIVSFWFFFKCICFWI